MNKPLHLFVGPSASGKTSVADLLEKYCYRKPYDTEKFFEKHYYKQVKSYTTRLPRYEGENNHVFITKEEFDKLENMIAYTEYDDNFYCSTAEQLDEADIYVVDIPGVKTLIENYDTDREIKVWYFSVDVATRVKRMRSRGDSDTAIVDRILTDEQYNWYEALMTLRDYAMFFVNKHIELNYIDADISLNDLVYEMKTRLGE